MRRSIAQHMSDSLKNSAQLSYFMDVDVTEGQRLRREASQGADTTITMAHLLIKACAETLRRVPAMNSVLANGEIHYFDQVNIGVAVALDDGLIVPVLRDVGSMNIHEIADATQTLSERARANDLSPDDVVGGTFTISVLGSVDGFTPILNPPQSGILGVGRSVQKTSRKPWKDRRQGDDDAQPDRRPPGNRRRCRGQLHAPPSSNGRTPGGAA